MGDLEGDTSPYNDFDNEKFDRLKMTYEPFHEKTNIMDSA